MRVAVGLFIIFTLALNSIGQSSQVTLTELFPPSEGSFLPRIEELKYAEHWEQLDCLRRLDIHLKSIQFNASSILLKRGLFVIGWNHNGIIQMIRLDRATPIGIYDLNNKRMIPLTTHQIQQLGVNHPLLFVRWIDYVAAHHRAADIPVEVALPEKVVAHHEAGIAANFLALSQADLQKKLLDRGGNGTYYENYQTSLTAIREVYDGQYVAEYKAHFERKMIHRLYQH